MRGVALSESPNPINRKEAGSKILPSPLARLNSGRKEQNNKKIPVRAAERSQETEFDEDDHQKPKTGFHKNLDFTKVKLASAKTRIAQERKPKK